MNNGQRGHRLSFIRLISIVPINVHQFIDDSEIYGTIIIIWCISVGLEWTQEGKEEGDRIFMALHLKERHVGASATFSIIFFTTLSWPLTSVSRNDDDLMIWNLISFQGKLSIFSLHNHYAVLRRDSCLILGVNGGDGRKVVWQNLLVSSIRVSQFILVYDRPAQTSETRLESSILNLQWMKERSLKKFTFY